jgi:hypothetical protein
MFQSLHKALEVFADKVFTEGINSGMIFFRIIPVNARRRYEMNWNKKITVCVWLGLFAALTVPASASELKDFRYGLGYALNYAGFTQRLVQDQYPGGGTGWTYDLSQVYNNKQYQFGNTTINLNGAVAGTFSISNRGYREVSMDLQTPTPLSYTYEAFVGDRKLHVDNGVFSTNTKIKINEFGIYNIQMQVSNRGTLVDDGSTSYSFPLDYDIGPINFQGQFLIDLINMTLGKEFNFTLPGGAADQIVSALFAVNQQQMQKAIAAYEEQSSAKALAPAGLSIASIGTPTPTPEPLSLVLMLLGFGYVSRRRK